MTRQHWLAATLVRAGVPGAENLVMGPGTGTDAVWESARTVLGLGDGELAHHVASRFHLRLADPENAAPTAAKLVPEAVARKHHIVPVREDDREIVVATADPTDVDAEQAIGFVSGRQVVFEVASPAAIDVAMARLYAPHAAVESLMERVDAARAESVRIVQDAMAGAVTRADSGESAAVIKLTNLILRSAIDQRATAVELGPWGESAAVSLLVDGVWSRLMPLPVPAMRHVSARLRLLGNLGIANRSWARGGVARIRVEGRTYDLLVSASAAGAQPVTHVRILDQQFTPMLAELGLDAESVRMLRALVAAGGLLVLTGPPDSGVTTLQYALLRELAAQGRRVMLVDEGQRWAVHGAGHVLVHAGDRAGALRSLAGRPLDVIGVDAADDADTVRALLDAVTPGRLVVLRRTAADAASASATLTSFNGGEPVPATYVAVRLLRRSCAACGGAGCEHCHRTGYRGVLPVVAAGRFDDAEARIPAELEAAARARVERGETTDREVARVLGAAGSAEPLPGPTVVLVADDDPLIRLVARTVLEADGMEALEAEDGAEALERLGERPEVDLLVVDLDMPRLDGHAVLSRLKRDVRTAGLPVIVLTASTSPQDETRALERGAADYIRKPIDPPRFQARVRAVLRRNRG